MSLAAKEFLEKLISYGKGRVLILYDRQNVYIGHKDKYGRKLGYIYVKMSGSRPEDDSFVFQEIGGETYLFVNATMVKSGYAFAYLRFPFQYNEQFFAYEEYARENKKGLWAVEDGYPAIWEYIKRLRNFSVKEIDISSAIADDYGR